MNLPPTPKEAAFLEMRQSFEAYKAYVGRSYLRSSIRNAEFFLETYSSFSKQDEVAKDVEDWALRLECLKLLYYQETGEAYDRTKEG
jgi:hypothetical protein